MSSECVNGQVRACPQAVEPALANWRRSPATGPAKPRTTPSPAPPTSPISLICASARIPAAPHRRRHPAGPRRGTGSPVGRMGNSHRSAARRHRLLPRNTVGRRTHHRTAPGRRRPARPALTRPRGTDRPQLARSARPRRTAGNGHHDHHRTRHEHRDRHKRLSNALLHMAQHFGYAWAAEDAL